LYLPKSEVNANDYLSQLWVLFNRFPTSTSRAANEQIALKREIVRLKREMGAVSAQDEFTKWAKLRRQHDKAEAEFNKKCAYLFLSSRISRVRVPVDRGYGKGARLTVGT